MIIGHGVSIIAHTVIHYDRSKISLKELRGLENLVLYNTVLPVHFIGFNRLHGDKKNTSLFDLMNSRRTSSLYSNEAVR